MTPQLPAWAQRAPPSDTHVSSCPGLSWERTTPAGGAGTWASRRNLGELGRGASSGAGGGWSVSPAPAPSAQLEGSTGIWYTGRNAHR